MQLVRSIGPAALLNAPIRDWLVAAMIDRTPTPEARLKRKRAFEALATAGPACLSVPELQECIVDVRDSRVMCVCMSSLVSHVVGKAPHLYIRYLS